MGIFGKKKQDVENDFDFLIDDDDFFRPIETGKIHRKDEEQKTAPHALTIEEVIGTTADGSSTNNERPVPDSVYKKMKESEKSDISGIGDNYIPSWAVTGKTDSLIIEKFAEAEHKVELSPEEAEEAKKRAEKIISETNIRTEPTEEETEAVISNVSKSETEAFIEKCKQAVINKDGDKAFEPIIEIIETKSDETPDKDSANKKPESVDDIIRRLKAQVLGETAEHYEQPENALESSTFEETSVLEKPVTPTEEIPMSHEEGDEQENKADGIKLQVEYIPEDAPAQIMHSEPIGEGNVRIYGKAIEGAVAEIIGSQNAEAESVEDFEATRMFDGLNDIIASKADRSFSEVEDDSYDYEYDEDFDDTVSYYESPDEALTDINDYKDLNDAARLLSEYRETSTRSVAFTILSFVLAAFMMLFATELLSFVGEKAIGIISLVLLVTSALINIDIFKDFKNLSSFKISFDTCTASATILMIIQVAISTFVFGGKYAEVTAAAGLLLAFNRTAKLLKILRIKEGLELIANSDVKRAVYTVGEHTAETISSGAVSGEILLATDKEVVNIHDYIKNSSYKSPFDLKVGILFIVGLSAAFVLGLVIGLLSDFNTGLTAASLTLCCCFPAAAALTAELPMFHSTKKASLFGGMLAGYKGAYELNLSNTVAVNTSDLFPEGSLKLYNMKTLSENEIGDTLTAAAAVSIAANSPLSSLFRAIIGDTADINSIEVNCVHYEDKMGISGWIGENTVLIGNRNLMQGHNIPVPPAAVDQKILKQGYFPVYISCHGKPCLLFLVEYTVDPYISSQLQALCNTGMTVVVNPTDPNCTSLMLSDYFGLPNDAIKVMNHNGRVAYENESVAADSSSAFASFTDSICGMFSAITSSIKLNSVITTLTAIFIIAAVLSVAATTVFAIIGKLAIINSLTFAAFQLLFAAIIFIISRIKI